MRVALLALVCIALPALAATHVPSLDWTRRLPALPEDAPTALARGPGGEVALGGTRSVRVLHGAGVPETRLRRGPVVDLAFGDDGTLWVATESEVYRVSPDGEASRESLARGDAERHVLRLAAARGQVAVATDLGVHVRPAAGHWERLRIVPSAPASLVAFRLRGPDLELWTVSDGELWIARLPGSEGEGWRRQSRAPLPFLERGEGEGAQDLAFELGGADAVLVFPDFLAERGADGAWSQLRPALPPGARARRIARAFDRLWLATDAGLLSASALRGPWRRAAPPWGSLPVVALLGGPELVAASHRGVESAALAPARRPAPSAPLPDPRLHAARVARLQRAALRHQGLRPRSLADARARLRRRGWLPELDVGGGLGRFRDRRDDYDQAFVSGDTRYLYDSQRDTGLDYDVSVDLTWELGDLVFHPDEIDLLRESRSQIALRDDVLDEVTALYFEREGVLARLASAPPAERHALALRAAELAAGLDAWTGGAFSGDSP
jgi:hypothetical protein